MNTPVPRRRPPELWRGGWPREFWDPSGEFGQLWERMGQFFESTGQPGAGAWVPTVETEEADDAYLVGAELPGMKRDDVHVELSGHELRITGEVKEESEGKPSAAARASSPTTPACPPTPTRSRSKPS